MGSIITFYSYKGGVGRSMALANIAFELAKRQKKILIVDWDLEAPGLEKYFSAFKIENSTNGLLQLLLEYQNNTEPDYNTFLSKIMLPFENHISLLHSGRDSDSAKYSAQLEGFNWEDFFEQNQGGLHLENLRQSWINDFDLVLIDSRTGLSDSSGICTIMMPDILLPMFTANYQSLFGIKDTVKHIQNARQKLDIDRMGLTILPIPARFGTRVEFKESQEWLDRIADILKDCFSDWLPKWIEPKFFLEQVKIPQIDYFSFGEKLAVHEQGTNDPEGMGYIYSRIAALLDSDFKDIPSFVGTEYYQSKKAAYEKTKEENKTESSYNYDVFISYPRDAYQWVNELFLPTLNEYLRDELEREPKIYVDFEQANLETNQNINVEMVLSQSRVLLPVISPFTSNSPFMSAESNYFLNRELQTKTNLIFPVVYNAVNAGQAILPEAYQKKNSIDLSIFDINETIKSTKLRVQFGKEVEQLAMAIAETILKKNKPKNHAIYPQNETDDLFNLVKEYNEVRTILPSGSLRTKMMNDIVARMKNILSDSDEILEQFSKGESPGERLVAISLLQKFPKTNYLPWLADHIGISEKPFIGYQAAVALYLASRVYGMTHKALLLEVISHALENVRLSSHQDPNQSNVLESAIAELTINKENLK